MQKMNMYQQHEGPKCNKTLIEIRLDVNYLIDSQFRSKEHNIERFFF